MLLVNNFEGGSNGTALTGGSGGNTGGTGRNFLDTVSTGTGTSVQFASARSAHGSLSAVFATGTTAATCSVSWSTSLGTITTLYFRAYLYLPALPGATCGMVSFFNGSNRCGSLSISAAGKVNFYGNGASPILLGSIAIPAASWFRVEGFITGSATAGQVSYSLYNSAGEDSTTADESMTSASTQNTFGSVTSCGFGPAHNNVASYTAYYDDIGVSDSGLLGPVSTTQAVSSSDAASASSTEQTFTSQASKASVDSATGGNTTVPFVHVNDALGFP